MKVSVRRAIALVVAATAAATSIVVASTAAGGTDSTDALGPGTVTIEIDIHHSRFVNDAITVRRGTTVYFDIDNGDPINHEFIVGDDEVHERHATGSEAVHPPVPGEVSVGPNESASTFYVFDEPGTVLFACHLPAHFEYGMAGRIRVVE